VRELLHAGVVADQHQRLDVVLDRSQPLEQALLGGGVELTLDLPGVPSLGTALERTAEDRFVVS
jgi:hypothetical protein